MSEFDILYNNMHRNFPKPTKSSETVTKKSSVTQEGEESKKPEFSNSPFKTLLSKIF